MNEKFTYDLQDKKKITVGNQVVEFYRIIAKRDINNPYKTIKAGSKGGYITLGALSEEDEAWIDGLSIVGKDCFVSGNAYVNNSTLVKDVRVGNSGYVNNCEINPKTACTVYGKAKLENSKIRGDLNLSGEARLFESFLKKGYLSMTDDAVVEKCVVTPKLGGEGISFIGKNKCSEVKIGGSGYAGTCDTVTISQKDQFEEFAYHDKCIFD